MAPVLPSRLRTLAALLLAGGAATARGSVAPGRARAVALAPRAAPVAAGGAAAARGNAAPGRARAVALAPRATPVAVLGKEASVVLESTEVSRERLVEICNALRDRWGSVERVYESSVGPDKSGDFQVIDMEAFMVAVETAEVQCSRAEMAQVFQPGSCGWPVAARPSCSFGARPTTSYFAKKGVLPATCGPPENAEA
ncbi:hypothetical protein T492DRAFT_1141835 [Pavlovales sp. CCMP2436]|nr:hypothetical protein T492DRAFT_1141835 [Pavlovales sp. CCMP2436]